MALFSKRRKLAKALDILCKAQRTLDHADFVKIWGEQLGDHIWRQEGSDLLRIWTSGLTPQQKEQLLNYLVDEFGA